MIERPFQARRAVRRHLVQRRQAPRRRGLERAVERRHALHPDIEPGHQSGRGGVRGHMVETPVRHRMQGRAIRRCMERHGKGKKAGKPRAHQGQPCPVQGVCRRVSYFHRTLHCLRRKQQ